MSFFIRSLRKSLLPLFARFNVGDIRISHHWTGDQIRLHSFRHKGYWFHRRNRERAIMEAFAALVKPGDTIVEVGGHIGYVSLYLSYLTGDNGCVWVLEPGINNLPYLRDNIATKRNISLVEKGAGSISGRQTFFIEEVTGQNNSFVRNFPGFAANSRAAGLKSRTFETIVDVITLDSLCCSHCIEPSLLKIDVEGFELEVLRGATAILDEHRPILMVEVQAQYANVAELLSAHGYETFTPRGARVDLASSTKGTLNLFCLHADLHRESKAHLSQIHDRGQ